MLAGDAYEDPVKILFSNNYSLEDTEKQCARDETPRHHLWGIDRLRAEGHDVVLLSPGERSWLRSLSRRTHFQIGELSTEFAALASIRRLDIDLVVCAEMGTMRGLGLLRRLGVLRTPLVGLLHPAPPSSLLSQWSVRGFDRVLGLSAAISRGVNGPVRGGSTARTVGWGPDLSFGGYVQESGTQVVCSGRTNRDFALLARACRRAGTPVLINGEEVAGSTPPVAIRGKPRTNEATYADLRSAAIVAIPLARPNGCFGITELNDALGCGKPVLMTRNPFIDVDIEEIGCGR